MKVAAMKTVRILLGGAGNAALPMLDLMTSEKERVARDFGIEFQLIGVADSKGAAVCAGGLSSAEVAEAKRRDGTVSAMDGYGRPGMTALDMIASFDADIYVDGLPPFLPDGEPGASNIRAALRKGMHVVTANKAPLALYWGELFSLAAEKGLQLRYGTAASSGLPTLEMGDMLGRCGELLEFGGIFNASCMYVIDAMKHGQTFDEAVQGAREGGFLEPNPAMDIDGWDSAMKTVIQANTYWQKACTLADIEVKGIRELTLEDIQAADARGETWCMVGRAVLLENGGLKLTAGPECLPKEHPLAKARWCDKALHVRTRTQGEQVHYCLDASASSTPGNMYLDMLLIARGI